jgi:SAM-dependent methyltransferase
MSEQREMTVEDLAHVFGTTSDDIPQDVQALIQASDFRYRELSQEERDQVILKVLKRLDADSFSRVGQERKDIWEQAWSERAASFREGNYALEKLTPDYIDANPVVRLNRDYVLPCNPGFERNFSEVFRLWLFKKYLGAAQAVYEFGCGSGFNLAVLGRLYPEKDFYGLDWAASAIQLVNLLGEKHGLRLKGRQFDFFAPDESLELEENCAVVTMCALEQIGDGHEAFIQFLLERSPALCLNMEPLCELYDENHLVDYLAIRYHRQRGYLEGFLDRLRQLTAENRIEIQKVQRVSFGSLYHEGYSFVVWRPVSCHGT